MVAPFCGVGSANRAADGVRIGLEDVNVLMGSAAIIHGGIREYRNGDHVHKLWMENWTELEDSFTWNLNVDSGGEYHVRMLICSHFKLSPHFDGGSSPVPVRLCVRDDTASADPCARSVLHSVSSEDAPLMMQFRRQHLTDLLFLPSGHVTITLQAVSLPAEGHMSLALQAVELVAPQTLTALEAERAELEGDSGWLAEEVPFGLFFHWNAHSLPLQGETLPYQEAVRRFDVEGFADMVQQAGARLVVFTTTWAGYYFPAPIAAIDMVIPGRTTSRDLVQELSEALHSRGIRFFLYYHYGKDDQEWWRLSRFREDTSFFWSATCDIIKEVGARYGAGIDGFWIDDGATGFYSYSPPWRKLWRAAKEGHTGRLVGYNPWLLPKPTLLQDMYAGELTVTDVVQLPGLPIGGDGRFTSGPQRGLQATVSGLLQEGDWTFMRGGVVNTHTGQTVGDRGLGQGFPPLQPHANLPDLLFGVLHARRRRVVPILNLLISQEGITCERARDVLRGLADSLQQHEEGHSLPEAWAADSPTASEVEEHTLALGAEGALTGPGELGPVYWARQHSLVAWSSAPAAYAAWRLASDTLHHARGATLQLAVLAAADSSCQGLRLSVALEAWPEDDSSRPGVTAAEAERRTVASAELTVADTGTAD